MSAYPYDLEAPHGLEAETCPDRHLLVGAFVSTPDNLCSD